MNEQGVSRAVQHRPHVDISRDCGFGEGLIDGSCERITDIQKEGILS